MPTPKTTDEGLIKDRYEILLREFQNIIYLFYGLLVGLGMLYNYYRFREFEINIFEYGDIFHYGYAPANQ